MPRQTLINNIVTSKFIASICVKVGDDLNVSSLLTEQPEVWKGKFKITHCIFIFLTTFLKTGLITTPAFVVTIQCYSVLVQFIHMARVTICPLFQPV